MKTTVQRPEIGEAIAEMVRRIIERFHPEKIILFVPTRAAMPARTAMWIYWW